MPMDSCCTRREALRFIILLGIVSLFADVTYEGARSITGPYLALLGAGAGIVGLVAGLGEFIGYGLRLATGYIADRTGRYWPATIVGYGLILSVPLIALAGHWKLAALFIIMERLGKAVRSPARDAILSHASKRVGRGWGFGLHEALDQIGAILGPLLFSGVFLLEGGYRRGFHILWIPALLAMAVLLAARARVPYPVQIEDSPEHNVETAGAWFGLSRIFWLYTVFTFFAVAGLANFPLIAYHIRAAAVVSGYGIPLLYALAMGVDALVALAVGRLYDRIGLAVLISVPVLTLPIPYLAFSGSRSSVVTGVILWGAAMGLHETIMRAAIADLTPAGRRGFAYGLFNAAYGLSWFFGSVLMGLLYEMSKSYIFFFVLVVEMASVPFFLSVRGSGSVRPGN